MAKQKTRIKFSNQLPQISPYFLEENENFCKTLSNKKTKKSGPYSKKNRETRRNKVYKLHFEFGLSARKIAKLMKINRNTINEDISFLYSEIAEKSTLPNPHLMLVLAVERLDVQRTRLRESLDKTATIKDRLAIEQMIFEIDSKLLQINQKLLESRTKIDVSELNCQTISEEQIREFTRKLFFDHSHLKDKNELIQEIIKHFKCDLRTANTIFQKMKSLGLEICGETQPYAIIQFALMKNYVTDEEIKKFYYTK